MTDRGGKATAFARWASLGLASISLMSITLATKVQADHPAASAPKVEEVVVKGLRQRLYEAGMLKDSIQKTEVVSELAIENAHAASLTEAIEDAPGVRVNNECSMCGVKRVMLNGMRGEHSTILVDGLPLHTMLSGFYGLDAVATSGIERIEIARGAGASLTAPEAIGGSINLISREAVENGGEIELSLSQHGFEKINSVLTAVSDDERSRFTLVAQRDQCHQYDGDDNGVSESPELKNQSLTLRLSQDLGDSDNVVLRYSRIDSEIFGGPMDTNIDRVRREYRADPDYSSAQLFEDGDVRKRYIGRAWETTEWIESARNELSASWLHQFSVGLNATVSAALSQHQQDSFYEGFVYRADNDLYYVDARLNWALNDDHMLSLGVNQRDEVLRSQSNSQSPNYVSDSFDYLSYGLYVQDVWTASADLEVAMALRFDDIRADFTDASKPGVELEETLLSPRLDVRYRHSEEWVSRVSAGRGYRAPLSFFESDHGILDGELGFVVDVDRLERSLSAAYALSFEGQRLSATASLSRTEVENLSELGETDAGVPVLGQMSGRAQVRVADIALSYALAENLTLALSAEQVDYDRNFKQAFGVVPVEQRIVVSGDWDVRGWDVFVSASWIGSRDLSEYATPHNPSFDEAGLQAKSRRAKAYWTVDSRVAKELGDQWTVYFGATNLLAYTQAEDMETPLFYQDGGYDVADIYGPLKGREIYAGVKYQF